jgi:hypothetical protein
MLHQGLFIHLNAFASTLFILFYFHKLHMHPVDVNPQATPHTILLGGGNAI